MRTIITVAAIVLIGTTVTVAEPFEDCKNKNQGSWLKCSSSVGVAPPKSRSEMLEPWKGYEFYLGAPSGAEMLYNQLYRN